MQKITSDMEKMCDAGELARANELLPRIEAEFERLKGRLVRIGWHETVPQEPDTALKKENIHD